MDVKFLLNTDGAPVSKSPQRSASPAIDDGGHTVPSSTLQRPSPERILSPSGCGNSPRQKPRLEQLYPSHVSNGRTETNSQSFLFENSRTSSVSSTAPSSLSAQLPCTIINRDVIGSPLNKPATAFTHASISSSSLKSNNKSKKVYKKAASAQDIAPYSVSRMSYNTGQPIKSKSFASRLNRDRPTTEESRQSLTAGESSLSSTQQREPQCLFTKDCNTGSQLRKVISHLFGRNRECTLRIPKHIWVFYCRKHYQRFRYHSAKTYPLTQIELVKLQIRRLEIWSNENKERGSGPYIRMWALSLRRREQSRLKNSGASVVDESSTMAIPLWLIQRVAAGYSAEKILSIAERLHKEIKEGHLTQVPEIEFLPDIIGRRVKANRRHGHSGSAYQPVSPSRKRARVMIPPSEDRRRSNFQYRSSPPPAKHYREAQQYHQQRQGSHPWDGSSLLYPPGSDSHYAPYSRRHQIFPPISTLLDDRFSRGVAEYHEHPQSCGRLISGDSYHSGVPLQAIPESRFATYLASRGSHPNHHPQAWTPSGLTSSTEDIHSPINKGIRISNEEETAGYKPPISNTPPTADDTWRGQVLDHYKLPVFDSLKISHREHSPALNSYPPPPPLPGLKRSHDALYGKEFCATHILESQHPNEHSRVSVFESQSYAYSGRYIAKPMSPSTSQHNNERYSNMGVMDSDTKQGQRRENLPKEATDKLRAWLVTHLQHPYPTVYEKLDLMKQTNLQWKQVSDWFINARRRQLPAMINKARTETDKMYSLTARRWSFNW